jgi:hypothetical protein
VHEDRHPAAPLPPAARLIGEPEHKYYEIHRSIVVRGDPIVNLLVQLGLGSATHGYRRDTHG